MEPRVKGSLVLGAVVVARRHRKQGRIAAEQLEARLSAEALALLDEKIAVGSWYPAAAFCELLDLDWEIGGSRRPDYMRRQGAASADRLFDSGIYQQLQYAERAGRAPTRDALLHQSKLITTVTATLYDFIESEVRLDAQAGFLEIDYHNAAAFSEALRFTTEGFMNRINERQGSARRWTSERQGTDRIVFRLPLPKRFDP